MWYGGGRGKQQVIMGLYEIMYVKLVVWLFVAPWTVAYQAPRSMGLGKNTGVGCHFLPQGIFPTQVFCIVGRFFTTWTTREAWCHWTVHLKMPKMVLIHIVVQQKLTQHCKANSVQFSLSNSATPWTAAHQASLSITNSRTLLRLKSIESVMPSHPLLSPSPHAFNLSQNQGLFHGIRSLHQVAKVLEFQIQHQSFQWIFWTDFL